MCACCSVQITRAVFVLTLLTAVFAALGAEQRRLTADIFGFARTSKNKRDWRSGFYNGLLLHAKEVKGIKTSAPQDLGHMLVPRETSGSPPRKGLL